MKWMFMAIGIMAASCLRAQSLYNNALISITKGSVLYVKDSLVNNGTLVNNGNMQIGGAWLNNAQYDAGQGQITFNGDAPQVINHNAQSFSKLTIGGGGQKIFQADITIENELNLSEGILKGANDSKIVFNNTAIVRGGSDESYIEGAVYHKGDGDKIFPVGNGGVYLPLILTGIQGTSTEVGVRVVEPGAMTLAHDASVTVVSDKRYWQVDVVSGALGNARVTLAVRDERIVSDAEKVVVIQAASVTDVFRSAGRASYNGTLLNGAVTSNDIITLPLLAVGIVNDNGSVLVYNAVSPNGDGLNDFLRIGNIESFPNNKVSLFNRWGDKVFEMSGYDNRDKVFKGKRNVGGGEELLPGTYYYAIDRSNGAPVVNGYLSLK